MENINNLDWELLYLEKEEESDEIGLHIDTNYEPDINELEDDINIDNVYQENLDNSEINEIEENEYELSDETFRLSELSESSECIYPTLDILYEEEMERETQMKLFLDEMQQKQLNEYIQEEEEYSKYEEEMMKVYNNEQEYSDISESSEESSGEFSEDEFSEESKKKYNKKRRNKLNKILDNKFVLFLGIYLIYEIIYGTE